MNTDPFVSICIPSYNRPEELVRELRTIDLPDADGIEIVICEDKSPKRDLIRAAVTEFSRGSRYPIRYFENAENLGYDKNLRELIGKARGEYIIFMGDDDEFVAGALERFIQFLKDNRGIGYVMKSHYAIHSNGVREPYKYYAQSTYFEPGPEAFLALFRKSVFISGFTFKREYALPHLIGEFDGTLLFQLYILAEITLKYRSAYCDIPLTQQYKGAGVPLFGSSKAEAALYTPGTVTLENSINFMKGYFKICRYLDEKYGLKSEEALQKQWSKYSYPVLSIQRKKGVSTFLRYVGMINRDLGLNITPYYYVYVLGLLIFGERFCDMTIVKIKTLLGRTPQF